MCVLTSVNFENFASFLANYQKVIHAKFVKILESQKCTWKLLHFVLKKHVRIRNDPKLLIKIPETKWEKNNWWKIFFSKHYNRKTCMHWHEYGIVIKQLKTINYWHILAPLHICFPYSHKKYNFMSTESEGCNRIF